MLETKVIFQESAVSAGDLGRHNQTNKQLHTNPRYTRYFALRHVFCGIVIIQKISYCGKVQIADLYWICRAFDVVRTSAIVFRVQFEQSRWYTHPPRLDNQLFVFALSDFG